MLKRTKHGFLSHFGQSSKHKRKYSDNEILNMKNRIINGESYASVAKDYGVHRSSIHKAIFRHSPIVPRNENIPKDYVSLKRYCELNNYTYSFVYYHIRSRNLKTIRKNNKLYVSQYLEIGYSRKILNDAKIEAIYLLHSKKWSVNMIADALSVNKQTVKNYIGLKIL